MKRKSIVLSLPSLILLAILVSTLGLDMFRNGGRAFSPGELSTSSSQPAGHEEFRSHSEFENECWRCHQPLRVKQAALCMECHIGIAEQIQATNGSHGAIVSVLNCYECHSDHKGKDFDPVLEAMEKYDHSIAPFSLRWHQVGYDTLPVSCSACHITSPEFGFTSGSCQECHASHSPDFIDQHVVEFGANCTGCHDGKDIMADFDHLNTMFPLDGKHAEARCAACHVSADFDHTPMDCIGCHSEPLVHLNQFDPNCSTCHNTQAWMPALFDGQLFDHESGTAFSLVRHRVDYSGATLACQGCHSPSDFDVSLDICKTCHAEKASEFMEEHTQQFGAACLDCHDGIDRLSDFDHASRFPLQGRHAEIECESCHEEKVFRGTPTECVHCHAEPEIHAGFFGLKCDYCHTADAWTPAQIRMHTFPLDHGRQPDLACQVCHVQVYQEYTCYGCHEHQPEEIAESHRRLSISAADLPNCSGCHPVGDVLPVKD